MTPPPELDLFPVVDDSVSLPPRGALDNSTLRSAAASLLLEQPLPAARLIERVCNMPGVPVTVADDIAMALLGSSPWFTRTPDGTWSLVPTQSVVADASGVRAEKRLSQLSYLVIDTETTGMRAYGGDRITEIAAYLVEGHSITCVLDTLVNPMRPIPRHITLLTGISWKMVRNAPLFSDVCAALVDAMQGRVFVAHNVSFDWRFVCSEVERATGQAPYHERLCTVKLARTFLPELPRRSLDRVAFHFGIEIEGRHRAAGDALATAKVLQRLLSRAADRGVTTWGELDTFSRKRGMGGRNGRRKQRRNRRWY